MFLTRLMVQCYLFRAFLESSQPNRGTAQLLPPGYCYRYITAEFHTVSWLIQQRNVTGHYWWKRREEREKRAEQEDNCL